MLAGVLRKLGQVAAVLEQAAPQRVLLEPPAAAERLVVVVVRVQGLVQLAALALAPAQQTVVAVEVAAVEVVAAAVEKAVAAAVGTVVGAEAVGDVGECPRAVEILDGPPAELVDAAAAARQPSKAGRTAGAG